MEIMNIKLEGYHQAKEMLQQFPVVVQKRLFAVALKKASNPLVQAVRNKVPKKTGTLAKSIRAVKEKYGSKYETNVLILPLFSLYKRKDRVAYGNIIHDGTDDRRIHPIGIVKRKGRRVFDMKAWEKQVKKPVVAKIGGRFVTLGVNRGRVKPTPFLIEAYDANKQKMIDGFGDEMSKSIEQYVNKNFKPVK